MKNVLLLSNGIEEINRMRRYFDTSFSIKATSNMASAVYVAESSEIGLVLYNMGTDFNTLIQFYRDLRESKITADVPLIVIAEISAIKPLNDCVELTNTHLVSSAVTRENIRKLIYGAFGQTPPEFS